MLKNLLRPKWQHPDPEIRARALTQGGVDTAIAIELAVKDPELRVRQSAVAALDDIAALVSLVGRCPDLQPAIAETLEPLLLPQYAGAEMSERELSRAIELLAEAQRLRLLRTAGSVRLRVLAIRWVKDVSALQERALEDEDIHVRKAAIAQLDCPDTLDRIAESSRGHSSSLSELAERRAEAVRRARIAAEQRQAVLTALQEMVDGSKPITEPAWEKHLTAWKALEQDVTEAERAAFDQAAAAINPELERQRQRRAADQLRQQQREQILDQLTQLGQRIAEHELDQAEIAIDMLRRSWAELEPMHDHWTERRLKQQFTEALEQARHDLQRSRTERTQDQIVRPAVERVERILDKPRLGDKDVAAARQQVDAVNARFKDKSSMAEARQHLRVLADRVAQRLKDQQAEDQDRCQRLKEKVEAFETALEAQELKPALGAHQAAVAILQTFGKQLPSAAKALEKRLHRNEPQFRQLKSWAHWGNDHARQELIDEATALHETDLSADQLSKQIKSLRERWKALGKLGAGGKAQWGQFDAACTKAYEPVKAQREVDQQQRKAHLKAREALCAEIEALTESTDWTQPDWRAMDKALQQFRKRWREAGPVPHKSWKKVLDRFDQAIDAFNAQLEKERRTNFLQRQALVREAEQLAEQDDSRAAVSAAKELRGRWQLSVRSHPKQERELWDRFSKAMDSVFGKEREERDQFKAGLNDQLKQGEALCEQLEALAALDPQQIQEQRGQIAQIEADFRNLGEVPKQARRKLEQRFEQAHDRLSARQQSAEEARRRQQLERLYQRHRLCDRLERAILDGHADSALVESLEEQWTAIETDKIDPATEQALQTRWELASNIARGEQDIAGLGDLESNKAARQRICLDLEILLGRDSPAEAQTERMARQVEMLQAAMSGAEDDRAAQVRRLKLDYLRLGAIADGALEQRFEALFKLEPSGR